MAGLFISFEGSEGCGKSTQIRLLAETLTNAGRQVMMLREPGGTPIGEEIRHTLQHSHQNQAMTPEAELLLINASRAQLVRERIGPALAAGTVVLCDRFYHSSLAYQGYGRGLDLAQVQHVIDFAIGGFRPDLTLLLRVPLKVGETRRQKRQGSGSDHVRDRMEEADHAFFERVIAGFDALAEQEPDRIRVIDATGSVGAVAAVIRGWVEAILSP